MLTRKQFVRLLATRRAQGETMDAISKQLGVTRQALYLWQAGTNDPPKPILLLAQAIWGVSK
jgi:transcriptional regulator with XRE-family HTH domain